MVSARHIALLVLLAATLTARGQYYATDDTVTEYPNKGTFYHDRFEGRKCASGEVFDQNKFTAAHWKIKMGTLVMVTNRNTGLQVIVKVNDRCPKRGVFDMSHRAANAIGIRGCQNVTVRILPPGYEERWAAQEEMFDSVASRLHSRPALAKTATGKSNLLVIKDNDRHASGVYNLFLAYASSHGHAYELTQRLPAAYRDRVAIESIDGLDSLRITLDVRFSKEQAEQLAKTLRANFPSVELTPAE